MTGPGTRVEVLPGNGVVVRAEGTLLVVPSVAPGQRERTAELVGSCRRAPDPTGRLRARAVAALISAAEDPDEVPGFALVLELASGTKVLAYGDVTVTVRGAHEESFDARDSLAWVERQLDPEFTSLTVTGPQVGGPAGEPVVPFDLVEGTVPAGGVTVHRSGAATTARQGAQAPAGRAEATPAPTGPVAATEPEAAPEPAGAPEPAVPLPVARESAPEQPASPEPEVPQPGAQEPAAEPAARQPAAQVAAAHRAAPPAPTEPVPVAGGPRDPSRAGEFTVVRPATPFRSVALGGAQGAPPPPRAPLPVVGADTSRADAPTVDRAVLVDGRACPAGHFNAPEATECARCGRPMPPGQGPTVRQARPPLGVLVTDDGSVFSLGSDVVIGREPAVAEEVQAGRASPLQLRDAEHSVSRVHARVTLEGWRVLLSDSGSSNGTFLSHHGQAGPWEAVPEGPPTPLTPGDRIRVGKRQLMFDRPAGTGRAAEG